jgi:hypothetical protein
MKKIISFEKAVRLSFLLFGLFILFHLSIIIGMVFLDIEPMEFLWGGRMETREQLLGFEIISLVVMTFCFIVVLIKANRIKLPKLTGVVTVVLWILFVLFLVNTVGNILAKTTFEKFFAIATTLLAFLCLRLALERSTPSD